jgi:hypothetical protein
MLRTGRPRDGCDDARGNHDCDEKDLRDPQPGASNRSAVPTGGGRWRRGNPQAVDWPRRQAMVNDHVPTGLNSSSDE